MIFQGKYSVYWPTVVCSKGNVHPEDKAASQLGPSLISFSMPLLCACSDLYPFAIVKLWSLSPVLVIIKVHEVPSWVSWVAPMNFQTRRGNGKLNLWPAGQKGREPEDSSMCGRCLKWGPSYGGLCPSPVKFGLTLGGWCQKSFKSLWETLQYHVKQNIDS